MNQVPQFIKDSQYSTTSVSSSPFSIHYALENIRLAPKGQRNDTLYRLSCKLEQDYRLNDLELAKYRDLIRDAALETGLDHTEITGTMESAAGAAPLPIHRPSAEALVHCKIKASPYRHVDSSTLPKREFLFGSHYIRKFVSATAAPGGVGKSAYTMKEAVLMASGRLPDGTKVEGASKKVWIYNLEDPLDELQRRIAGILQELEIEASEIEDRLFLNSGRDIGLVLVKQSHKGTAVAPSVHSELVGELVSNEVDVLIVDPFVSSHEVSENDNSGMNTVIKTWAKIANDANVAVELVHHTRKENEGYAVTSSVDSFRGGRSLTDGVRHARLLVQMTKSEAEQFGVENPKAYFQIVDVKSNMTSAATEPEWQFNKTVDLKNGDSVGVPVPIQPRKRELQPTDMQIEQILEKISDGDFRESEQAAEWGGKAAARVLNLDVGFGIKKSAKSHKQREAHRQVRSLLSRLIISGKLIVEERKINGKKIKFVRTCG